MSVTIWIIDDSPTVRKILETTFSRENYSFQSFGDGVEALKAASKSPGIVVPDIIFLDITLPKMDGYEVARKLKENPKFSKTAIVMLTRRAGIIDRLKARLTGATAYMTKPFKTQDIREMVKSITSPHEPAGDKPVEDR